MFKAAQYEGRAQALFLHWDLTFVNQTLLLCAAALERTSPILCLWDAVFRNVAFPGIPLKVRVCRLINKRLMARTNK